MIHHHGFHKHDGFFYGEYALEFMVETRSSGPGATPGAVAGTSGMLLLAPGLADYFMPSSLYVSGAVGLASISSSEREDTYSGTRINHTSQLGFGGNPSFGKEWWVSSNWALGGTILASYARARERDTEYPWSHYGISALFSATYN